MLKSTAVTGGDVVWNQHQLTMIEMYRKQCWSSKKKKNSHGVKNQSLIAFSMSITWGRPSFTHSGSLKSERGSGRSLQSMKLSKMGQWEGERYWGQSQGLRCSSSMWRLLEGQRRGWLEQLVLWLFRLSVDSEDPGEGGSKRSDNSAQQRGWKTKQNTFSF